MLWLAAHMWFLLIVAFLIGLTAGWWIWGPHLNSDDGAVVSPVEPLADESLGTLESDAILNLDEETNDARNTVASKVDA